MTSSTSSTPTTLTPILSAHWDEPDSFTIAGYRRHGGYEALRSALAGDPADVLTAVKDSGLRGRGGAGFPTGLKWAFLPKPDGGPRYLVVNADESEPGTCKDIPLMLANPHSLIEGVIMTSFAIGGHTAFIYLRGEVVHVYRRLLQAVEEACAAGFLGSNILGSGFDLEIVVHAGAGAYICGEETALLDSLEGRRGQPRLKPPFPAVAGLYARPTVVNNVESIASVPAIVARRRRLVHGHGHREVDRASALFAVRARHPPGQYEAPLGITLRELLDHGRRHAQGPRPEVLDAGRLVDPDVHRRAPRRPAGLRVGRRGRARCSAPAPCRSSTRPPAWCAPCCGGPSSTSTSRAASAPRAGRAPTG